MEYLMKIREKLIHALGGVTKQEIAPPNIAGIRYRNSPQVIRSTHRLSLFEEGNRPQIEQYIKADMCKEIMRCMVENGAIDFKTIEEDGDTTILATVRVLVPETKWAPCTKENEK